MLDTHTIIHHGDYSDYTGQARQLEHISSESGVINYWSGKCRNLDIRGNAYYLRVSGSMPTFLYGTNFTEIADYSEIQTGLNEISDYLSIHVFDWVLTRFDFPFNIELSESVKDYLLLYEDHPTMKKATNFLRKGSQILYRDSSGYISMYDKIPECKNNNIPFPEDMVNANVGRIERSFGKTYLNSTGISTAKSLLDPDFYQRAAIKFATDFFAIRRKKSLTALAELVPTNTKEINSILQAAGVEHLGYEQTQSLIQKGKKLGASTPDARYRMQKHLRSYADNPQFHFGNELTKEFDSKVMQRFKDWGVSDEHFNIM